MRSASARAQDAERRPWISHRMFLILLGLGCPFLASCGACSGRLLRVSTVTYPAAMPGLSITDVYAFPSPTTASNVVLVLNVHPGIPAGQGLNTVFDPRTLHQFKIDNTGDYVEDLVIQLRFRGSGPNQTVTIAGPTVPQFTGTVDAPSDVDSVAGMINNTFTTSTGIKVFAGAREDPFFFDLQRFYAMLPDRATEFTGTAVANPNQLLLTSFRAPGQAQDFFANLNVMSIVLELPKSRLGSGVIHLWATTGDPPAKCALAFSQIARQARPLATTVFPSFANRRQQTNNQDNPTDDVDYLGQDIQTFMVQAAGRSQATIDAVKHLFTPDVLVLDLAQSGPAGYLGVETNGVTGGKFGGRPLDADVADVLFGIIFGRTIATLGLAPDDGLETLALTTDNVGPASKHFLGTFPFLGAPR